MPAKPLLTADVPVFGVQQIIAIASGKGGVGKSTVAVNLALALSALGKRVGLLDADIYGPSQPWMLGAPGHQPVVTEEKKFHPVERYGMQTMSIGYLVDVAAPMIWRGPMVSTALQQMCRDTQWDNVDILLIDLPPGTGDIQLTLAQKIPVNGAVIVTTPQNLSLIDARKALLMFQKLDIPVLGVIENMSHHVCVQCGHESFIFGQGGGQKLADEQHASLLGILPLDARIQREVDGGKPTVVAAPESDIAKKYRAIAARVLEELSQHIQKKKKFPRVSVEK